ncbi:MAG TPA: hypothetical protein VE866_10460 [Candidatus Binatia bacterium]|nr:hypothetical protein [Candidatus Binatia bacterium]
MQIDRIQVDADSETLWALAELCKRIQWAHMRECAVDDNEAYRIRDGVEALEKALKERGYAPR